MSLVFIACRKDGLGERLRALVNAMILSRVFDGFYKFTWPIRGGRQAAYNSICPPTHLFSSSYCRAHLLDEMPLENPISFISFCENTAQICSQSQSIDVYIRVDNQYDLSRHIKELRGAYGAAFIRSFTDIEFTSQIKNISAFINSSIPDESLSAVHLRAGDIVYGIYSDYARFANKALPFQVANDLIRKINGEGKRAILFGQDESLINFFSATNLAQSSKLLLRDVDVSTPIEQAMADIFLMRKSSEIYSGSSGFAVFSALSSGASHIYAKNLYSFSDIQKLFGGLTEISRIFPKRISLHQSVFSLRWLLANYYTSMNHEEILSVCLFGLAVRQTDVFFCVILASALAVAGNEKTACRLIRVLEENLPPSHFMAALRKNNYGRMADEIFKSLLTNEDIFTIIQKVSPLPV